MAVVQLTGGEPPAALLAGVQAACAQRADALLALCHRAGHLGFRAFDLADANPRRGTILVPANDAEGNECWLLLFYEVEQHGLLSLDPAGVAITSGGQTQIGLGAARFANLRQPMDHRQQRRIIESIGLALLAHGRGVVETRTACVPPVGRA